MGRRMTTIAISKPALLSMIGTPHDELRTEAVQLSWRCGCSALQADFSVLWQPCHDHRKGAYWLDFEEELIA